MTFFGRLTEAARRNNSLLCVGLDPRPERFPPEIQAAQDPILAFNRRIVDATRDLVCAYKPNYAFYEAYGTEGLRALRETIAYIGEQTPVILDAKRGDIGSTAEAYARAAYEVWGAGAVTVAPYLGRDAIAPFTAYADRAVFLLCHTSNPSAGELQTLPLASAPHGASRIAGASRDLGGIAEAADSEPLYLRVARLSQSWPEAERIGLVVGATYPEALHAVRLAAPQAWMLVPGIGTQGGDVTAAIHAGLRKDGLGLVVNVSRGVCHAEDPRAAAAQIREQINAARRTPPLYPLQWGEDSHPAPLRESIDEASPPQAARREGAEDLILDLARIGAVRFGQFTLKSGASSPIYIDLRLLASHPDVLARAAAAYADLLRGLEYQRIAAIPYAALPIGTAVALQTGDPLIYPRKETKDYGTRRAIEGVFQPGERAVVLDDLITTGGSKIEAIVPLEQAGLTVRDIAVLIDRQSGGQEELAQHGYALHAVFTLQQILDVLAAHGVIDDAQRQQVLDWLGAS